PLPSKTLLKIFRPSVSPPLLTTIVLGACAIPFRFCPRRRGLGGLSASLEQFKNACGWSREEAKRQAVRRGCRRIFHRLQSRVWRTSIRGRFSFDARARTQRPHPPS